MRELTLRGFDAELADNIRQLAQRESISMNHAALRLLRRGAGLAEHRSGGVVGSSLDHFIGSWTNEQAEAMKLALKDLKSIDPTMWK